MALDSDEANLVSTVEILAVDKAKCDNEIFREQDFNPLG